MRLLLVLHLYAIYASDVTRGAPRPPKTIEGAPSPALRVARKVDNQHDKTMSSRLDLQADGIDERSEVHKFIDTMNADPFKLASMLDTLHASNSHSILHNAGNVIEAISIIAERYPFLLPFAVNVINNSKNEVLLEALEKLSSGDLNHRVHQEKFRSHLLNFDSFTASMRTKLAQSASGLTRSKVIELLNEDPGEILERNVGLFLNEITIEVIHRTELKNLEIFPIDAVKRLPSPAQEVALTCANAATCKAIFNDVNNQQRVNILKFFSYLSPYLLVQYFSENISVDESMIELLSGLDSDSYSRIMFMGDNEMIGNMIMKIPKENLSSVLAQVSAKYMYYKRSVLNHPDGIALSKISFDRLLTDDLKPMLALLPLLDRAAVERLLESVQPGVLEELLKIISYQNGKAAAAIFGTRKLDKAGVEKIRGCKPENLIQVLLVLDNDTKKEVLAGISMAQLEAAFDSTNIFEINSHPRLLEQRISLNEEQRGELVKVGTLSASTILLLDDATRDDIISRMQFKQALGTFENLVGESVQPSLTPLFGKLDLTQEVVNSVLKSGDFATIVTFYILSTIGSRQLFDDHEGFKKSDLVHRLNLEDSYLMESMIGVAYLPVETILKMTNPKGPSQYRASFISFLDPAEFSKLLLSASEEEFQAIEKCLNLFGISPSIKRFPRKFPLNKEALNLVLEKEIGFTKVIARYIDGQAIKDLLTQSEFDVKIALLEQLVNEAYTVEKTQFVADYLLRLKISERSPIRENLKKTTLEKLDSHE